MADEWQNSLDALRSDRNVGYGAQPFPTSTDEFVSSLVARLRGASNVQRAELEKQLTDAHSFALLMYAERMANEAVRTGKLEHLQNGLCAVALEDGRFDARENILVLSVLYRSAQKLGVDAEDLFAAAATLAHGEMEGLIREFPARPESARSIEAMGYRETVGSAGFFYERTW
jgi:hypothetical protein